MSFFLLVIGFLVVFCYAKEDVVVVTAISSSEDTASTVLLDSVLLPFVNKKKASNYYIDVIPSGGLYLDKKNNSIVCEKGESQCYKNLLQYCVIREYSYEIAHEFVRCVQTRNVDSDHIYGLCKRFGLLYYKEIDKCLERREEILKELYNLGRKHMAKKVSSIPQLMYGKQFLSLDKLLSNSQLIYDRLKSRLCNLGDNAKLLSKACSSTYNILIDPIMIHQQEQSIRNSRSDQRLIKYTNEVYTIRTLQAFSNALQVNDGTLTVLFDVTNPAILQYLPELMSIPERFVTIDLYPIGSYDMNKSCTDEYCTLYKTLLCGNDGPGVLSIPYITCILQAKQLTDNVIRSCSERSHLFPPSVISCLQSPSYLSIIQQNITQSLHSLLHDYLEVQSTFDLAASMDDEDILLEAEADNEDVLLAEPEKDSLSMDLSSLFPVSFFFQSKRIFYKDGSLKDFICSLLSTPSLFCSNKNYLPISYKPQVPISKPFITIYLNTMCKRNILALEPLMEWFIEYPSLTEKVTIDVNPFIDLLIDKNDQNIYEFRTPHDHNHIAKAFATACVIRMTRQPSLYWDFLKCIHEKEGFAATVTNQCSREVGLNIEELQYCLTNEEFIEQLWKEKREEYYHQFWATVSPYVFINNNHVIRLEMIAKQVCELIHNDDIACSHIPSLNQGISHCMISALY